ncbi:hypothetical protein [Paenibacillus sp. 1001270B_150601_E10]|uniref:hypothetical protein n=1 Tax=Paenibacillus sp. 1001270B_150601_E10 TaxID=2787079 RepID=UPI00189F5EE2|nr:hypothetical protein [Paenibacillus sp. 1001270B_150601_E10]
MKNIMVFGSVLFGSILFDLLLDVPLGIPMFQDIISIVNRILLINPILLTIISISVMIIIVHIGKNKTS